MSQDERAFTESGTARKATKSDLPSLGSCLARAFEDDPVSAFFFPDPRSRPRRLDPFYRFAIESMAGHGVVYTDRNLRGAAVWQAPLPPAPVGMQKLFRATALLAIARTAFLRVLRIGAAVQRAHILEPHWYLAVLGTEPVHQGKGVGSSLMHPVLRHCDAEGLPAYLESSKRSNILFYERHGFRVTGEIRVAQGPTLWPMLRAPRGR
ncbi:MAG: GNAT family N-acetyltransferase [Deltaproteobacteria bacterium]|nr:GNAT family N-acetyltransferase [Deltaproteobacteria bacterium]MBW2422032.1 GNAT family N-acetyltransferase [Deltaproteobacteria bacterium]